VRRRLARGRRSLPERAFLRTVLVAGLLGGAALLPGAADRKSPFRAPQVLTFESAGQPACLASADFDGDGRPDLVVGRSGSDDVTFFANAGGSLRRTGSFPAGHDPTEILAADLDRDGRIDLAIANHETSYVTILKGDGHGGFRPAPGSPLTVHSRPHPHTIDACDANGDGWPDLVIDDWEENSITLVLGDGHGGFRGPGTTIPVGRKPYRNLRVADFDGDGRCDVVVPSYESGVVTLLLGDGRGGFRAQPPIAGGPAPFSLQVGDLNHDGRLDLAIDDYSGQVTDTRGDALTFLLGDGKGGFRLGPRLATGAAPTDVAIGDVDGDGFADAVTADYGGSSLTVSYGGPDGLAASRTVRVPIGRRAGRVLLVDLDGDGRADAITAGQGERDVTVFLSK
jgi:hypothetical protein